MAFTLRKDGIRYSPTEQRLFRLLPKRNGRINSAQLAKKLCGRAVNGRVIVVGMANSLINKSRRNREPFKVCKTKRCGPHPIEYWVERRL